MSKITQHIDLSNESDIIDSFTEGVSHLSINLHPFKNSLNDNFLEFLPESIESLSMNSYNSTVDIVTIQNLPKKLKKIDIINNINNLVLKNVSLKTLRKQIQLEIYLIDSSIENLMIRNNYNNSNQEIYKFFSNVKNKKIINAHKYQITVRKNLNNTLLNLIEELKIHEEYHVETEFEDIIYLKFSFTKK